MIVPPLEPSCNSWIIISKKTGEGVLETWQRSVVEKINTEKYTALSAYTYLCRLNQKIKGQS